MKAITKADLAKVDVLTSEMSILNDLIAGEQDDKVREELTQERLQLVCRVNQVYGTDHIAEGSRMEMIE